MIEQTATVLRVDDENVVVEVRRQPACGSCSAKAGCGKSLLDNVFKVKPLQVSILNTIGARENDSVIIGLNEAAFVKASFYLYIFPLLSMLFFSVIAGALFEDNASELFVILAAVAGLFLGSRLTRVVLQLKQNVRNKLFEPVLIRVVSAGIPVSLVNNI